VLKAEFKQKGPQLSLIASELPDTKQLRNLRRDLAALATMLSQPVAARSSAASRSTRKPAPAPSAPARPSGRTRPGDLLFQSLASKDDGN
jgi:hypothetical protein